MCAPYLVAICSLLIAAASLVAKHRLWSTWSSVVAAPRLWRTSSVDVHRLSCPASCGPSWTRGQTVSPALAGSFFTTEPPRSLLVLSLLSVETYLNILNQVLYHIFVAYKYVLPSCVLSFYSVNIFFQKMELLILMKSSFSFFVDFT